MQYIRKNYNQDITLSYISNKYHINQNYFCRLFKDVAGKSFNKFLTSVRIEKACEMIENSSLKINKIAELIGYSDPKYFSKVFKSETGVTPSEYLSWHR
jgi:two-component system response regulator YesN